MNTEVTLTLPEAVYQQAARLASVTNRPVSDVLAEVIAASLPSVEAMREAPPVSELSDREVLALSKLNPSQSEDERYSQLLDRQQAGVITDVDRAELSTLLQRYQWHLLRKAEALAEAVKRGLREPLTS
jgi:hypothetical protein